MRLIQNYSALHWLFIISEILLLTYQIFRLINRSERRRNWFAVSILTALLAYNFTLGWQIDLPSKVAVNMLGIVIVAISMLFFVQSTGTEAKIVDLFDRQPEEIFVANCHKYALSVREVQIADLVCKGYKNKRIAEELFISEKTVDTHLRNIYEKVGVRTKIELIIELNR